MRLLIASLALVMAVSATACAGRKVEVTTGPQPAADVSVRLTNNLSQAVNVYVTAIRELNQRQTSNNKTYCLVSMLRRPVNIQGTRDWCSSFGERLWDSRI